MYDFTRLDDGRLGILIADVTGHGVNSALLSTMVKAIASPVTGSGATPSQVMEALDAALERFFPEGFFLTAFYLWVDEATGALQYAGVGHPPPLVVGPSGIRPLDAEAGLLGIGMAVGIADVAGQLAPGESLLLYTDGLTDAMTTPGDVLFGQERIEQFLTQNQQAAPEVMLSGLLEVIAGYVKPGQAGDDINLVLVQYPSP